jgi:glutaconyl-CoA/methylmalonyl-CoA decarboxylase subunit gamma
VRYHVTFAPDADGACATSVVDVVELPNGTLETRVDGRLIDLDVVPVGRHLSVRAGGRVIDLTTDGTLPEMNVTASGRRLRVRVESERTRLAERGGRGEAERGDRVVKSPMAGRVVRVLVARGEAVQIGQGLVVLEAMKMENEVRAGSAGTVADVHVAAGTAVERNAKLVTLA